MKRPLMLILTLLLFVSMLPIAASAEELQIEVSGCNCTRDAGKLIVYTEDYGKYTSTNQWGVEAIVNSNNRVIAIVKGNAEIPAGGFVVSGHDNDQPKGKLMKTWINENIQVGDYVYFSRRTSMLTVSDVKLELKSPFFSFDNPADGVDIPRGDDGMVIYTPAYGKTTGTNEYGYEVVVEDGVVTALGGNNSVIPENGYVVSLHGSTARWMRLKLVKGMTAEYDDTLNVVFSYSADGLKKAADYSFKHAQSAIDSAKAAFINADYAAADTELTDIREKYQAVLADYEADADDNAFADDCDELIMRADAICNKLCDSYPVQYRGAWIRPSQSSAAEVKAYVKKLHEAGINFMCVEGWFENGVIMNVPDDSLFTRHPSFNFDVLQAYIDACHQYGMECHLWMPILNVGSLIDEGYEENSVPGQKPEWLSLNQQGLPYNKDGFMMIDPANKEARDYLLDFYKYIVTTYDIDCFEMDYIRYYATNDQDDFGYTQAAFDGFEAAYHYGETPTYDRTASYWEDWCQYRRDCVTEWVKEIRKMIDREAPDVLLAADVAFPFEHAANAVYQDFPRWLTEGIIDILHPMAYGDGYGDDIRKSVELAGERCMVVTGLGAQTDILGATELERQAREDNEYGAYGDCYFEAHTYLSDQVPAAVLQTVYRQNAIPPFLDVNASVHAALDYMLERVENIIVPLGGMTEAECTAVSSAIGAAKDSVEDGRIGEKSLTALNNAVAKVKNDQARTVLSNDLYRAERIACVKHRVPSVVLGHTDASSFPVIPVVAGAAAAVVLSVIVVLFVLRKRQK